MHLVEITSNREATSQPGELCRKTIPEWVDGGNCDSIQLNIRSRPQAAYPNFSKCHVFGSLQPALQATGACPNVQGLPRRHDRPPIALFYS